MMKIYFNIRFYQSNNINMKQYQYMLLEDFYPFKKDDLLNVTHRTTLYTEGYAAFDNPNEYGIVFIPKELLEEL